MVTSEPATNAAVPAGRFDPESASWLQGLTATGIERDAAVVRLHAMLLRVTTAEVHRRSARFGLFGPEMDDLAHHAAADATLAVSAKITKFRGESRFTTWAYKFAVLEVSAKLGRHFWRDARVTDTPDWDTLPARAGTGPGAAAEGTELLGALRAGVEQVLTERQRRIFVAVALNGIPLDAVVAEYGTTRNAVYKTMFDARRKLRAHLIAGGFLGGAVPAESQPAASTPERGPTRRPLDLDRFLHTDPRDVGCGRAMRVLHRYVELVAAGPSAIGRHPGVAEHLRACGPCGEDFQALLDLIVGG